MAERAPAAARVAADNALANTTDIRHFLSTAIALLIISYRPYKVSYKEYKKYTCYCIKNKTSNKPNLTNKIFFL